MTSSAAEVSPPPPKPSTSDEDEEGYETEYEEIEVEEEIEVDEEIDEDMDIEEAENVERGGEVEIGEDLTVARQGNVKNDTGKILELDEHTNRIQPSSLTHGVSALHSNIADQKTSESSDKKELCDNGKKISKYNNQETPPNGSGEVSHTKSTPFTGVVNATSTMPNASGDNENDIVSLKAESNQSALKRVVSTSPRLHASQIRLRDPLPSADFDRETKKIRIACEFHAKGWCIRGNSCKFLHIKDGSDAVSDKSGAMGREASSSTYIPPVQSGKNVKLYSETGRLVLPIDDTFLGAPSWEDRGSFKHNPHLDNYRYYGTGPVKGGLSARGSAYHGISSTSQDNSNDTRVSGFKPTMEEIIRKKSNVVQGDPWLADLPYPHSKHSLVFGSSSQNTSAHGPHEFLPSSLEHRAYLASSMKQISPPASRSQPETLSCNADPGKSEGIFSSFSWEPSVPFSPSHEITRSLLLKGSLYNPTCGGTTDKKDVKDGRMKFSNSDQGSSIKNVNVQSNTPHKEKLLNMVFAGDSVKDNLLSLNNDDKHDNLRDGVVSGVDGSGKIDGVDDCFKRDDHVQIESKPFKYFQSALIELVKDLVKPTWREGLLSKDAHKLVVKKAVDKVLITLQPHQIPSTAESVKLYLTSSQPKLAKLVEGYINKYGKT